MAYDRISPLGPERIELAIAINTAVVANVFGGKKGRRPKPQDFIVEFDKPRKVMTSDQIQASLKLFASAHNASRKRGAP